ncbi:uncharacterized protein Z519_10401 [Cladophialophora bantiana CBS 173.52]|uniref:J domain-containing protein n=1 Tax=Cladophialophora bantiana (strain ATCC 10958 / CBS 173.52 / CDC B-1940 / NIH 8579) TaxID=1442370 RepID=A0A0D2FQS2_CLAB1|nr:uncharacterized protein Z519_10401 [Cladophialophora bantiana CBS 173.52]KIW88917.1 hypothetical protein Z519_10401 [Cladophialophora bantiana CBS 173.52]
MTDHYTVLGVSRDATHQQIKAAYNKLVLQAHPDKGGSQLKFIQIHAAWEVLRDPASRATYDGEGHNTTNQKPKKPRPHAQAQNASGAQFPRNQAHAASDNDIPMPGGSYSQTSNDKHRFGSGSRPNGNSWTGYRESAAGSAYNSYYGASASAANDNDMKPRASSTSTPEDASHHQSRNERSNSRESYPQPRPRGYNASPPPRSRSRSPPPTVAAELNLETVKALVDKASRNLIQYKHLLSTLRSSTKARPLSPEIQIKLEHVHGFLQNRVLKLNQRVNDINMYNLNLKTSSEMMDSFFVSLWQLTVNDDMETLSDLGTSMSRVMADTNGFMRNKMVLEARGLEACEDDKATQGLRASTEALERLLTKVLLTAPGVAPPRSY